VAGKVCMRTSVFSKLSVVMQVLTVSTLSYKWFKIFGVLKFEVYAVVLMEIPLLWDATMWLLVNSYCHDE